MTDVVIDILLAAMGLALILYPSAAARWIADLARTDHPALQDYPRRWFQLSRRLVAVLGVLLCLAGSVLAFLRIVHGQEPL